MPDPEGVPPDRRHLTEAGPHTSLVVTTMEEPDIEKGWSESQEPTVDRVQCLGVRTTRKAVDGRRETGTSDPSGTKDVLGKGLW